VAWPLPARPPCVETRPFISSIRTTLIMMVFDSPVILAMVSNDWYEHWPLSFIGIAIARMIANALASKSGSCRTTSWISISSPLSLADFSDRERP
jgi:hypothetical protein